MDLLEPLVAKGLRRELPTREEALAVLATPDEDLLDVVAAAGRVRRQWFGRRVKLNYLVQGSVRPPTFIVFSDRPARIEADITRSYFGRPGSTRAAMVRASSPVSPVRAVTASGSGTSSSATSRSASAACTRWP